MFKPFLLGLYATVVAAGCAATSQTHLAADTQQLTSRAPDRTCLKSTGTRIQLNEDQCAFVTGRSYSNEDIDSTGAFTTAEALRMLDPSISIGR